MKWNAFSLAEPALNKTKELLFPIKLRYWLKLGFVSFLSVGTRASSGFNFSNFDLPNKTDTSEIPKDIFSEIGKINFPLIGIGIFIISLFLLAWKYITSIFTFIFLDALIKKKYSIKESWNSNKNKGISYFLFRIIVGLIYIAGFIVIFSPLIIQIMQEGLTSYFNNNSIFEIIGTGLFLIVLFIIWIILFGIFTTFVNSFAIINMYKNQTNITKAIKNTFRLVRQQKLESLVYFLALFVFNFIIGLISLIAIIPVFLVFLLVFGLAFLSLYLISKTLFIVMAIILLVPCIILFLYTTSVVLLPLFVFLRYFTILAYEKLFNSKILSNN